MKHLLLVLVTGLSFLGSAQICGTAPLNGGTLVPTTTAQTTAMINANTYYTVHCQAGCEYTFSTCGLTGSINPILRVYDNAGPSAVQLLSANNNAGCGNGETMTFLCNTTADYVIHIAASTLLNSCNTIGAGSNVQISYYLNCSFTDNECYGATQICNDNTFSANTASPGSYQELNASNQGCLSGGEHQSYWYYFQPVMNGTISFTIDTNADYDFALWSTGNCGALGAPTRCSYAAPTGDTGLGNGAVDNTENAAGDKWVAPLNVVAGQTYLLLIDNFSANNSPYTIDWTFSDPGLLNCNPVILPVEIYGFSADKMNLFNLVSWTTESESMVDHYEVDWSVNPELDTWKTVYTAPASGNLNVKVYGFEHYGFRTESLNYYRLVRVDNNGARVPYPEIKVVNNTTPTSKVVKVLNILGQEVSPETKGTVIYVYEDGTIERSFNR